MIKKYNVLRSYFCWGSYRFVMLSLSECQKADLLLNILDVAINFSRKSSLFWASIARLQVKYEYSFENFLVHSMCYIRDKTVMKPKKPLILKNPIFHSVCLYRTTGLIPSMKISGESFQMIIKFSVKKIFGFVPFIKIQMIWKLQKVLIVFIQLVIQSHVPLLLQIRFSFIQGSIINTRLAASHPFKKFVMWCLRQSPENPKTPKGAFIIDLSRWLHSFISSTKILIFLIKFSPESYKCVEECWIGKKSLCFHAQIPGNLKNPTSAVSIDLNGYWK